LQEGWTGQIGLMRLANLAWTRIQISNLRRRTTRSTWIDFARRANRAPEIEEGIAVSMIVVGNGRIAPPLPQACRRTFIQRQLESAVGVSVGVSWGFAVRPNLGQPELEFCASDHGGGLVAPSWFA
jgi:hypothetical protein